VKIIELDPETWLHKEAGSGSSYLHRPTDGKMCCMGVMCRAYGLSTTDITGRATLYDVRIVLPTEVREWHYRLNDMGDRVIQLFYTLNDHGRQRYDPESSIVQTWPKSDADLVDELNAMLAQTMAPFRFVLKQKEVQS
jgi:hypothetical protein